MAKNIIVDTGFWIALFTDHDAHHLDALIFEEYMRGHKLLVPYPTLYEFVNTKLTRGKHKIPALEKRLKSGSVELIDERDYRDDALNLVLENKRKFSLVDQIIRLMLDDDRLRIHAMMGFNYNDFSDVCFRRQIEMIQ